MDYVRHVVDSLKSSIKRAFEAVQFESASLDEMDAHLGHCIDYLRQVCRMIARLRDDCANIW